MPDKKLTDVTDNNVGKITDAEIVKGLEICSNNGDCKECPINPHHGNYGYCTSLAIKAALDLINRQKAEIKKLRYNLEAVLDERADHSEAYKEFAERLKDKHRRITDYDEAGFGAQIFIVEERVIDNLLKELVGDNQ